MGARRNIAWGELSDRDVEDFTADAAPAAARARALRRGGGDFTILPYFAGAALVVGGLLSMFAYSMPPCGLVPEEGGERWRFRVIRQYLAAAAERESEQPLRATVAEVEENREGSTGTRARLLEGKLGARTVQRPNARYGVERQSPKSEQRLARSTSLEAAREFGLIGLLREDAGSAHSSSAPWRDLAASGSSNANAVANLWGSELQDAYGLGGLGLSGTGEGGGGRGEGIGLGDFGALGRGAGNGRGSGFGNGDDSLWSSMGWGTCGASGESRSLNGVVVWSRTYTDQACQGSGRGTGIGLGGLAGAGRSTGRSGEDRHAPQAPRPWVTVGSPNVSGRLPPEVIQRTVRQNFGRFRHCYERGLVSDPTLEGRVTVRFVIARDGSVANTAEAGSDLPNAKVVACVVHAYYGLSFPEPDGGIVTVVYPIVFSAA
jgi:hypothetical protein